MGMSGNGATDFSKRVRKNSITISFFLMICHLVGCRHEWHSLSHRPLNMKGRIDKVADTPFHIQRGDIILIKFTDDLQG